MPLSPTSVVITSDSPTSPGGAFAEVQAIAGQMTGVLATAAQGAKADSAVQPAGNVATATKLATPRNINGVPFDGTANISVPATVAAPLQQAYAPGGFTIPTETSGFLVGELVLNASEEGVLEGTATLVVL